ncbi:tyrosine-type recombinase/integrase [Nonomuraea sp. NPDC003214]
MADTGTPPSSRPPAGTTKRVQGSARTQEDARKKLTELLRQSDEGIPVSSENWTLADFLTYWLKNIVSQERHPKTYQGYESVVHLHLVPGLGKKRLGKKRLGKLNAQDVRLFTNRVRSECQCCRNGWDAAREKPVCCALKGGQCCDSWLSTRMVQFIHAVLRNALECAVREEIVTRNAAKLVKVPVPKYKVNRGLTVPQARAVLKAPATTASTRCTSWRSASACAVGNSSGSAGRT